LSCEVIQPASKQFRQLGCWVIGRTERTQLQQQQQQQITASISSSKS
jgi:hypothetical protein